LDQVQEQEQFVTDYIRELDHDAVALRAERVRQEQFVVRERGGLGPRVRVGTWLIGLGEAIVGPSREGARAAASHDAMGGAV
jgi:hypothetical protein